MVSTGNLGLSAFFTNKSKIVEGRNKHYNHDHSFDAVKNRILKISNNICVHMDIIKGRLDKCSCYHLEGEGTSIWFEFRD